MPDKEPQWEDSELKYLGNDKPKCPHCDYDIDPTDFRGTSEEWDCPSCGKRVLIEAEFSVSYSTYKPKEKPNAH